MSHEKAKRLALDTFQIHPYGTLIRKSLDNRSVLVIYRPTSINHTEMINKISLKLFHIF